MRRLSRRLYARRRLPDLIGGRGSRSASCAAPDLRKICASVFWLFTAACAAPTHGEWDPRQCADGLDNDADGRIDCADPDCWAFACASGQRDAGVATGGSAGASGQQPPMETGGMSSAGGGGRAGASDMEDAGGGTAGAPDDGDAGVTPAPECSSARQDDCGSGNECVSGRCQPVDITGKYALTIVSAQVPLRTSLGTCYDADVFCALGPCEGSCQPDPYVVVTKNSVVRVGATPTQTDTTMPRWSATPLEVQLSRGDSLLFGVWEADTFGNSEMFSCSPQLQVQIRSGSLRCSPSTRTDASYEVVALITKL